MVKWGFAVIFLLVAGVAGYGQYYSTGQDPASLRWRQIKTDKYRLIFPVEFEHKAQYLANILDITARNETKTLQAKVPRIPVLLHTQTVTSNGVTVWAPKRIEMYTCPSQITYAEEWLEQLTIHEYRHAVQISKMNQGFTKGLYVLFGEQATGAMLGLFVPAWFLEGDATVTETALSKTGRGRSALFEAPLRAQLAEKGIYSYDKAVLGSYKTYVPDAYMLGYFLVGQARRDYGADVWNLPIDRSAKLPFMVVPFSSGIKQNTGLSKTKLYRQSLTRLDSGWGRQMQASVHTGIRYITKRNPKNHTNYIRPLLLNDSTILADRSSMDDVDRFVTIDRKTGKEHILLTPGHHISGTTSVSDKWITWAEEEPDIRWGNRSYAEIKLYDREKKRVQTLLHGTRYFSPVLSSDGLLIAAVTVTPENKCSIRVVEVPSGKIVRDYPLNNYDQAITPNWSSDASKIIFTLQNERGQTIAILDVASGRIDQHLPFVYNEFTGPTFFFKQYIIFSIDYSGVENIYALDTLTHTVYQVTSSEFGAFDPDFSSDKRSMIYCDYTSDGLMVGEADIDTSAWIPLAKVDDHRVKLHDDLARQEGANIQDSVLLRNIWKMNQKDNVDMTADTVTGKIYTTKKYSKAAHLFNPHSWAPLSFDITNLTFNPGVMVLSQNTLSTTFASAGWEYDVNEQTGKFFAGLSYRGWYPVFDFRFDIGNRASYYKVGEAHENIRFTFREMNFKANISIPFNFSHGRWERSLTPSIGTTLTNVAHNGSTPPEFTEGLIQSMNYRVYGAQYQRSNLKDVYPRIGQVLDLNYGDTPFNGNNMGSIFAAETHLFFPGIFRHHGIWFYTGYQRRYDTELAYSFADMINFPRGYSGISDPELLSLKFNYKLPLFYPDFSAGSVMYVKRFTLNLFYDRAQGWDNSNIDIYESAGAELTADFHLLRFVAPIEMGVRSIWFPLTNSWGWEFLYSISY